MSASVRVAGRVPSLPPALDAPVRRVRARLRVQRALDAGVRMLALGLAALLLALGAQRLGLPDLLGPARALLIGLPLLGLLFGALRPVAPLLAPRLLDGAHGTNDLIASGVAFAAVPSVERTPFMGACLASAERAGASVLPARALPLRVPRELRVAALLLLGTGAVLLVPRPRAPLPAPAPPAPARPKLLHAEDIALAAEEIAPLLPALRDDPALEPLRAELSSLLEALHDERLERAEALLALRGLEERLSLDALAQEQEALKEALEALGKTLEGGVEQAPLADALARADAEQAQREAEQLAARMAQEARDERSLARALERAGKTPQALSEAREQARRERERLLARKPKDGAESPEQRRLLDKKERELERLERELERREHAERSLEQLRRELEQSGRSLSEQQRARAQEHMQRGAQQLGKLAQKQLSAEQRAQLGQRLAQLRELIGKQRAGQQGATPAPGEEGTQRLDLGRFGQLARGQRAGEGDQGSEQGEGGEPQGMRLAPGAGDSPGMLLKLPGAQGEGRADQDSSEGVGGTEAGHGGRPQQGEQASARGSQHVDTRVEGQLGEGPTRSESIREAGQRGFASRAYRKVHADYARHAEQVLERDHVPGGYRFYVRRYFQLIRPREESP